MSRHMQQIRKEKHVRLNLYNSDQRVLINLLNISIIPAHDDWSFYMIRLKNFCLTFFSKAKMSKFNKNFWSFKEICPKLQNQTFLCPFTHSIDYWKDVWMTNNLPYITRAKHRVKLNYKSNQFFFVLLFRIINAKLTLLFVGLYDLHRNLGLCSYNPLQTSFFFIIYNFSLFLWQYKKKVFQVCQKLLISLHFKKSFFFIKNSLEEKMQYRVAKHYKIIN